MISLFEMLRPNTSVADIIANITPENAKVKDELGRTPLHFAQSPEVVRALVRAGADVNARDRGGWTPLHTVQRPEVIQALVRAGADVNARNHYRETPLQLASLSALHLIPRPGTVRALQDEVTQATRWSPAKVAWGSAVMRSTNAVFDLDNFAEPYTIADSLQQELHNKGVNRFSHILRNTITSGKLTFADRLLSELITHSGCPVTIARAKEAQKLIADLTPKERSTSHSGGASAAAGFVSAEDAPRAGAGGPLTAEQRAELHEAPKKEPVAPHPTFAEIRDIRIKRLTGEQSSPKTHVERLREQQVERLREQQAAAKKGPEL